MVIQNSFQRFIIDEYALKGIHYIIGVMDGNISIFALHIDPTDPSSITIHTIPNKNWYVNSTLLNGPFTETHIIAYFPTHSITYKESTILLELKITPKKESSTTYIYYIHHQQSNIGSQQQK